MHTNRLIALAGSALLLISALLNSCSSTTSTVPAAGFTAPSLPQGALFAATSKPGKVYRYLGGSNWEPISGELGSSVDVLTFYNGQLYAAVSLNDIHGPSVIFRYTGGETWSPVSGEVNAKITAIALFRGRLYAAAVNPAWNKGQLIRFDEGLSWSIVADSNALSAEWQGFQTLYPTSDYLYIGASNSDFIARYDGVGIEQMSSSSGAGIRAMEVFQGELYAGAMDGWLYTTPDGVNFTQQHSGIYPSNILSMKTFKDDLFIGMYSAADGPDKEQLYRWNSGALQLIWENSSSGAWSGVVSMVTNGTSLYFGTGVAAGFPDDAGNGIVYVYDGARTQAISGRLGSAITQLVINEISLPALEIASVLVSPSPMLSGGTFLAYLTLRNPRNVPVYLYEAGFKGVTNLPSGWYAEFIDIGTYGASWEPTTLIQPGETADVVAAITVPCGTNAGIYALAPTLTYGFSDVATAFSPAQNYEPAEVEIKDKLQGAEMASYRHAQGAVRQIRALDRNIENGVITTAIDLTYIGIDGVQKNVTVYAVGGRAYRYLNEYRYAGEEYRQDDYYRELTAYAYAEKSETRYQSKTEDNSYYSMVDSRPYYTFDLTPIPAGSSIVGAQILFYTGYGYPLNGNFYVDVYSLESDPAAASPQAVFDDAGNGTLYADNVPVNQNSTIAITPGADFLASFAAAIGGTFSFGVTLEDALSSADYYEYSDEIYSYSSSISTFYTSYGRNPAISADTIQYTNPEEALHLILNLYREGSTTEANEKATHINEKYYSIGFWGLAPGQDECNEGNGGKP